MKRNQERDTRITLRTCCRDCSLDTTASGDWLMVHNHVWLSSGLGCEAGVLCIPCLEQRLGRELTLEDFVPADPLNRDFWHDDLMLPQRWQYRWRRQAELWFD